MGGVGEKDKFHAEVLPPFGDLFFALYYHCERLASKSKHEDLNNSGNNWSSLNKYFTVPNVVGF